MASFVIHNIAAERLLNILESETDIKFTEEEKNRFKMANLIVDSSRLKFTQQENETEKEAKKRHRKNVQDEKIATHFRGEDDLDKTIQVPVLDKFTSKYGDLFPNTEALGYLFHLFTDKKFFEDLFIKAFDTLDEDGNLTNIASKTKMMRVAKNGKLYTVSEFWDNKNPESIYEDYTIMNKILLDYYHLTFDKDEMLSYKDSFINTGIEEVDFDKIDGVVNKTNSFIEESHAKEFTALNIFDTKEVIKFIEENAREFIREYAYLFQKGQVLKRG